MAATKLSAGLLSLVFIVACSQAAENASPTNIPPSVPAQYIGAPHATCDHDSPDTCSADVVQMNPRAVRCREPFRYALSPANFSISDIGKAGVPSLTPAQISLVRLIRKYVQSDTIRFAIVRPMPLIGSFLVFDAKYGPCPASFVEYWIMNNGYAASNGYYFPRTGDISAGPPDVAPSPGPWCKRRANVEPCFLVNYHDQQRVAHSIPIQHNCGNPPRCVPEVPIGRYGWTCIPFEYSSQLGAPSYDIADAGKLGVPKLSRGQLMLIRLIRHYKQSNMLRFAVGPFGPGKRRALIVFDATEGPCYGGAPGYLILNDKSRNGYYQPGEAADDIHAAPFLTKVGPWCRPRRGVAPCD